MKRSRRRSWRGAMSSRNFRLLLLCDVTSMVGTSMALVAIPFAILRVGGDAADIGYVAGALLASTMVFLLLGGVVADRLPRTRVLLVSNLIEGAAQASFGALVLSGRPAIWLIALLTAARGAAFGFSAPATQGLVPQTVPAPELSSANAMLRMGLNGGQIGGGALGGIVVATVGPGWGLIADAATYAIAGLSRVGMRIGSGPAREPSHLIADLREGWQAFVSRRWLWVIVVQFGFINAAFTGGFLVLGPVVAARHLGGAGAWAAIITSQSVGSVFGAVSQLKFKPKRLLLAAEIGLPLSGLPLLALGVPLPTAVIAALAFVDGVAIEVFGVNWAVAMAEQIPPEMLSRVSSYDWLGSLGLSPLGTIAVGPLAAVIGLGVTLYVTGGVVILAGLAALGVHDVRSLRRRTPGTTGDGTSTGLSVPASVPGIPGAAPDTLSA